MSLGSVQKFLVGVSRVWSATVLMGCQSHFCCHLKQLTTNLTVEEQLTDQLAMSGSLQLTQGVQGLRKMATGTEPVPLDTLLDVRNYTLEFNLYKRCGQVLSKTGKANDNRIEQ